MTIGPSHRLFQQRSDKAALLCVLYLLSLVMTVEGGGDTGRVESMTMASSRFKAPHDNTPLTLREEWNRQDRELWRFVESRIPEVLDHTGSAAFDEHLKGVQAVLRYWGAPTYLTNAGLFHSIYGTEGFQGFSLPLTERETIQQLIGERAELLCFWFCMVDRNTLDETIFGWNGVTPDDALFHLRARPELGRFPIIMNKTDWLDFVELTLADWLEQVEGAASKPSALFLWNVGEAFSHRRLAFHRMSLVLRSERSDRLRDIPMAMLQAVFANEPAHTRHLVQPRTPPMSQAAVQAMAALRANGEPIPVDFAPIPWEINDTDLVHDGEL